MFFLGRVVISNETLLRLYLPHLLLHICNRLVPVLLHALEISLQAPVHAVIALFCLLEQLLRLSCELAHNANQLLQFLAVLHGVSAVIRARNGVNGCVIGWA